MRRRDHPQIGEIWVTSDRDKAFTVLDKQPDPYHGFEDGWLLTILVDGNIEHASLSSDFKELDGIWWKAE